MNGMMPAIQPILTTPADATGDGVLDLLIQDMPAGNLWFIQNQQNEFIHFSAFYLEDNPKSKSNQKRYW